jgi:hypothetical protein
VASSNKHAVNFLDFTLSISLGKSQFVVGPYAKKTPYYPIPSTIAKRNFSIDKNIILSQILRTYRLSNDNFHFTSSINKYLPFLLHNKYHKQLRHQIFRFLQPIKLSTHKWTTKIPVCSVCQAQIKLKKAKLEKILPIDNKYCAIKEPINCTSKNIYLIIQHGENFNLQYSQSLHSYLQDSFTEDINILPIGKLTHRKLQSLLIKFTSIQYENRKEIVNSMFNFPCRIYKIFENSNNVYGIKTAIKKQKTFNSYFNKYKKISRNCK